MTTERMLRVNELLKREIGMIYEQQMRGRFEALVTITGVSTAPDLRHARVDISVLGSPEEQRKVPIVLNRNKALFQAELAKRVKLKFTPVLLFRLDQTLEKADRLLHLLDELDVEPAADDSEPESSES